jgi:hypothetical protein
MNPKFERAIGKLLRGVRANEKYLALNDHRFTATPVSISLTSSAFVEGDAMPKRYAGQGVGDNLSPPLGWADLPAATRELVLIMQDPDAPLPRPVTHVSVTGIPVGWTGLAEGALAATAGPPLASLRRAASAASAMPGRGRCQATARIAMSSNSLP